MVFKANSEVGTYSISADCDVKDFKQFYEDKFNKIKALAPNMTKKKINTVKQTIISQNIGNYMGWRKK